MVVVLAVQVLTDNLDMCLLAHLLRGLHSKTNMASAMETDREKFTKAHGSGPTHGPPKLLLSRLSVQTDFHFSKPSFKTTLYPMRKFLFS